MKNICKHIFRLFVLWLVLGMCYAQVELFWRGHTYLSMTFVGGLAGLCIGLLNQHPSFFDRKMWQQSLIGTIITLFIEYWSGYILNIRLHLKIWDYSSLPLNLNGQICAGYALLWFLLMPVAIYTDDWLRYKLFSERRPQGGPLYNYVLLFDGK